MATVTLDRDDGLNALHPAASFMGRDQFLLTSLSEDQKEGFRAFLEKRPDEFKGD